MGRKDLLFALPFGMFALLGVSGIAAFAYMRIWVVTADAFDPAREQSVDCLFVSVSCFLTAALVARLSR